MNGLRIEWSGKAYGKNQRLGRSRYGGFYLNKGYRTFQETLVWQMVLARCQDPAWAGPFAKGIGVRVEVWVHGRRDVDSLVPVILDSLEKARIVDNDKHVVRLEVKKNSKKRGEEDRVVVCVGGRR